MRISYGIVWREGGAEHPGRLEVRPHGLVLLPLDGGQVARELAFDEIEWVEIRPLADETGRAAVVVKVRGDDEIWIESGVDRWIVGDLAGRLFEHGVAPGGARRRMVLTIDGMIGEGEHAAAGPDDVPAWRPGLGL
jgi:hypothetical protein